MYGINISGIAGTSPFDWFDSKLRNMSQWVTALSVRTNTILYMKEFFKNFYQMLEVAENATPDQIKTAHRKLAMQYHPDKNDAPLSREKWDAIQEAYEVLMDPERRKLYDSQLRNNFRNVNSVQPRRDSSNGSSAGALIAVGLGAFLLGLAISERD